MYMYPIYPINEAIKNSVNEIVNKIDDIESVDNDKLFSWDDGYLAGLKCALGTLNDYGIDLQKMGIDVEKYATLRQYPR